MVKRTAPRRPQPRPFDQETRQEMRGDRSPAATMEREPQPDEIARRAYAIFCERGCQDGRAMDDWLKAEHELRKP